MDPVAILTSEWERIGLLAACVTRSRRGEEISRSEQDRLLGLQESVAAVRGGAPWQSLARECGLASMDQDILACAIAPEADPRVGWMFQELQPGLGSSYPTPALIRELFYLDHRETDRLHQRLGQAAPLRQQQLLEQETSADQYRPVRATARARAHLLGWHDNGHVAPPGVLEISSPATMADLVVPPICRKGIREFLLWVTERDQVVQRWGARAPGGPVALFSGPSGTGKTFAAEAVANSLGWQLYRVDLGLLVSKYIGETEKNLNALLDAVHGRPLVLLFDEADSLFGKRGEIREARDRYANMEVSHLLTRIERHQGPCILTSNLRQHLDPAFARRFQVVIEFPRPHAAARVELWRKHLPPKAPLASQLDLALVARAVPLTGGQIRNAALHAAFIAAGESMPITLGHVASAVWTELGKDGRETMHSSLGELAAYLPAELGDVEN